MSEKVIQITREKLCITKGTFSSFKELLREFNNEEKSEDVIMVEGLCFSKDAIQRTEPCLELHFCEADKEMTSSSRRLSCAASRYCKYTNATSLGFIKQLSQTVLTLRREAHN